MGTPRVVIGSGKAGRKCRVRYPSQMSGYITHTFVSIAEAKRYISGLNPNQAARAKITKL